MRQAYYAGEEALARLLESLDADDIYAAVRRERGSEYCNLSTHPDAEPALREPRPAASPRAFLQPARERVAAYTAEGPVEEGCCPACGQRALVGLRACDLKAIAYLDKVLREGEVADPFYEVRRESDLVIAVDCVAPHEDQSGTRLEVPFTWRPGEVMAMA